MPTKTTVESAEDFAYRYWFELEGSNLIASANSDGLRTSVEQRDADIRAEADAKLRRAMELAWSRALKVDEMNWGEHGLLKSEHIDAILRELEGEK